MSHGSTPQQAIDRVWSTWKKYAAGSITAERFMKSIVQARYFDSLELLIAQVSVLCNFSEKNDGECALIATDGGMEILFTALASRSMRAKIYSLMAICNIALELDAVRAHPAETWLEANKVTIVAETTMIRNFCAMYPKSWATLPLRVMAIFPEVEADRDGAWDAALGRMMSNEVSKDYKEDVRAYMEAFPDVRADFYGSLFEMPADTIAFFYSDAIEFDRDLVEDVISTEVLTNAELSISVRYAIFEACVLKAPEQAMRLILNGGSNVVREMNKEGSSSTVKTLLRVVDRRIKRLIKASM